MVKEPSCTIWCESPHVKYFPHYPLLYLASWSDFVWKNVEDFKMFYLYPKRFNENLLMFGGEPYVSVLRVLDFQNK